LTSNGVGTCGADDNQAQAGHLIAQAVHENQRGEITTPDKMGTLKTGGGKPGQGYPCIVQPLAVRGREDGAELEITPAGSPSHALRTPGGGSSHAMVCVTGERTHTLTSEGSDASEDGTGRGTPIVAHETVVRRLTELECERLQGYPDGWTDGQSGAARYRQLGNSIAVPVFEWVARRLVEVDESLNVDEGAL
jgi:DNA (cytosine-5)-methyltransferase 1